MKNWLSIISIISCPCIAQTDSINPYYREFENKISTKVFVLNNSNNFLIDYENQNLDVELRPNNKTTLNIGVQYEIISLSIGFAPGFFAENSDTKGSRMRSFSLDFFPGRWMQSLEFHDQRGMTLIPSGASDGLYLKNLESTKIGGSTSFFLNRKFSYRAIALQNVQQLHSAGSFSGGLTYRYTELNGKKEPQLGSKTSFFDVAFTPAYHYNWVIGKHVNLAGGISIGAGMNFTDDEGDKKTSALYTSSILLAPGYNSETWFFGANLRASYFDSQIEQGINIGDRMVYSTIFVGYRFDAPKYLVSATEKIKNKLNKKK